VTSPVYTDLIVVGAGPAGAAAAIAARNAGLRVTLIEREASLRSRPGEAVHPGIEPLLARLGVRDAVLAADFLRHDGHWVEWAGDFRRFVPFGTDADGPWRGFQMWRPAFDAIMIEGLSRSSRTDR
jgi:2-polyprenyl-6-methoxyphenol hydroxylase-like FAD-dependent oxidoreductase